MKKSHHRFGYLVQVGALAVVYLVVARLGLQLDAVGGFATLVWPPTGIALAALLIFGHRLWPGVALGAVAANLWAGAPFLVALGIGTGNTLEALGGAYALVRFAGLKLPLDGLVPVIGLIVFAALASTAVSATIGVASLILGGVITPDQFRETWSTWWLGDALGNLIVAPMLLVWNWRAPSRPQPRRMVELTALGALTIAAGLFVFFLSPFSEAGAAPAAFVTFPVLIWAALRFGLRGTTVVMFVLSAMSIWGTAVGPGPLLRGGLSQSLFAVQTLTGVAAAAALVLGATVAERLENIRKREEFLAVVSHDLKNPLSAIGLAANLMRRRVSETDPVGRQVAIIQRSVERMSSLIRDLLDLAGIDAGRLFPPDPGARRPRAGE